MPLSIGDTAPTFTLSDVDGNSVDLASYKGKKIYLALLRYSACMMCEFHLHQLKKRAKAYKEAGVQIICVYESPPAEMKKQAVKMAGGAFPLLVDLEGAAFGPYQTEHSCFGSAFGAGPCLHCCTPESHICHVAPCFAHPCSIQHVTSKAWNRQPADFLIGEDFTIKDMHMGQDFGDHVPWARIDSFAGIVGGAPSNDSMMESRYD